MRRPNSGSPINSTDSEGIAYGMLLAVYADDQAIFDKLWQYAAALDGSHGLMNWDINAAGTPALGHGRRHRRRRGHGLRAVWPTGAGAGSGSLTTNYLDLAKKQIGLDLAVRGRPRRNDVLTPGDQFADGSVINISYFAPGLLPDVRPGHRQGRRLERASSTTQLHASSQPR